MKYISVKEAAEKWGISEQTVKKLCKQNKIEDAFLDSGEWAIPEEAVCPKLKDNAVEAVAMLDCRVKACISTLKVEE